MFNRRPFRFRKALIGTALAGALLVTGCTSPTPYRPATGYGANATGYTDQRIEPDRYMVSFQGNSATARETVERYLLYRAAQLTLEQGYDYFVLAHRDTDKQTRTYATGDPFGGPFGYGGWNPYWRYYSPYYGWGGWGPYGDPFWGGRDIDVRTIDKYQAMAEIVLGRGEKPKDNVRAFDARAVIDNLGPTVRPPERG
ncbi:CC0125/CC1285 family lipoprotein [Stakelama saccharophila]|uniref:DUF4136 domain-containing protein n=1 Tax=Stakelama saccharophila TaxID=3075605 RepID=A0ABZ0B600_9SPHN|nr:hypothetical protein [Stakelama sp. W311]WNO52725.1 hypothetical protein RPR59_09635 [Stakelama sp. W311]